MIKTTIILLTSLFAFTSCVSEQTQKTATVKKDFIVNGKTTSKSDFKSVIALSSNKGRLYCTGNLYQRDRIMTAGHCIMTVPAETEERVKIVKSLIERAVELAEQNDLDLFKISEAKQKDYLLRALRIHINKKAKEIFIHFGTGKSAGNVKNHKQIVSRVKVSREYLLVLFNGLFAGTDLEGEETHNPNADQAILILKKNITHVKPILLATKKEFAQLTDIGASATIVGFGVKFDPNVIQKIVSVLEDLEKKLKEEENEEEKEKIAARIEELREFGVIAYNEYQASGDKNQVVVKIEEISKTRIVLITDEKEDGQDKIEGACFGDSGGPIFGKLPNGQLRQIGTVSGGMVCGFGTSIGATYRN